VAPQGVVVIVTR